MTVDNFKIKVQFISFSLSLFLNNNNSNINVNFLILISFEASMASLDLGAKVVESEGSVSAGDSCPSSYSSV